jgi:two-component system, OmpR family, alkaline phosphatase synthesis response regulator PhoP
MEKAAMGILEDIKPGSVARILVVDDDPEIVRLLGAYLERAGCQVLTAGDGDMALYILRCEHPDLVVLDLTLPSRDGRSVMRAAREDPALADIPMIVVTARVEDADRILGLELGADDYITKPFNPREVVLRVRTVLRRSRGIAPRPNHVLQVGKLLLDVGRHEVLLGHRAVDLTLTEFRLLEALMQGAGSALTRQELTEQSLGYAYGSMERTLDSHIKNLRKKIEPDPARPVYIETVYGVGYRMVGPAPVGQRGDREPR